MDYYKVLELNKDATTQDIDQAFRRLSLRYHNKICTTNIVPNKKNFSLIAEAYEILSDPIKKAFIDKFGQNQLKEGFFNQGMIRGGYQFQNNQEEIFDEFYLKNNPISRIKDDQTIEQGSMFAHAFGGQNYEIKIQKSTVEIHCTLEELYNGVTKDVVYQLQVLNQDGRTTKLKEQMTTIYIKPGFHDGQELFYPGCGNQNPGQDQDDLIFVIKQIPNPKYSRSGNDLYYKAEVSLLDAINILPIEIIFLDDRVITVSLDQIINPQYTKKIPGEGMPVLHGKMQEKGDLYVKFDIKFPQTLTSQQKEELSNILNK